MRDLIGLRPRLLLQPGLCDRDRAFGKKIVPTSTFFVQEVHVSGFRCGDGMLVRVTIVTKNASTAHNGAFRTP
jgi:hypothetical protein